jgi:hypothetical protein
MSTINYDEQHWLKQISDAIATRDPALSNQKITLVHYELSRALHAVTGDTGANFHTWAVWGSRKAGVTIRQEDLSEALRNATMVAGIVGLLVGLSLSSLSIIFWLTSWSWLIVIPSSLFGMICGALTGRWIATYSRREASRLILEGNQIVLDDIGKQTARFIAMFHDKTKPDPQLLSAFLNQLRPGDTVSGGQDLLRRTFSNYYIARYAEDVKQKYEATYFANCLAVLHEHIRLEPYIKKSMPFIIRKCATKRLMQFDVGRVKLKVSEEVPQLDGLKVPTSMNNLQDKELVEFLNGPDGWGNEATVVRANDWTNIRERMRYIVQLFRVMHLEGSVFAAPFVAESAIESTPSNL